MTIQNVFSVILLWQMTCAAPEVFLTVREEQKEGVKIGNIGNDSLPPYQFLSKVEYVRLHKETGDLYTTERRIDRESLCPKTPPGECLLHYLAMFGPQDEFIQVTVAVEDINDNAPHFQDSEIRITIPEDVAIGTCFVLDDQAQDKDAGDNGKVRYHMEDAEGLFDVDEEGTSLVLVVQGALDREARNAHRMTLVATDNGSSPLSSTATLLVEVKDVNDNCPVFLPNSPRAASVPGSSPRGSVVTRVRAVDPDLDPNAAISYSFSPKISHKSKALFALEEDTGLITLSKAIDSNGPSEYVLQVLATGLLCSPVVTQVIVSVLPEDVQQPAILVRYIAEHRNQTILLLENEPPAVLALVELSGTEGALSIEGDVPFLLRPHGGSYHLIPSKPLDFEQGSQYLISVVTSEVNVSGMYQRMLIPVQVEDVNDNAPQFRQVRHQLEMEENNKPGKLLLQVTATDLDTLQNGQVVYSLGPDTDAVFQIDPETGRLYVTVALDREQQGFHNVTVVARDKGWPTLETTMNLSVHVLDQNDNSPVFARSSFTFFVPENFPLLGRIGLVGAQDADEGPNGLVEVLVLNNSTPFLLDNSEGALRCIAELDHERQDRYELLLLARDYGRPSLSTTARVYIFVEDVNDNPPHVVLPDSNLTCLSVPTGTALGVTITRIYAVDKDSGINSDISYHIGASEPPGSSPFQVDTRSGNITLAGRLLQEHHGTHHLLVVARDGGVPIPLQSTIWINLRVNQTAEPCQLSQVPVSVRLTAPTQRTNTCNGGGPQEDTAHLLMIVGLSMMACSLCLFLITVTMWIRQRTRRGQRRRRPDCKEIQIPLRLLNQ